MLVVGSFCELSKNFHHEGYDSYWEHLEFEICSMYHHFHVILNAESVNVIQ